MKKILIENAELQILYTQKANLKFVIDTEQNQENADFISQWTLKQHENALQDKDIHHLILKSLLVTGAAP